MESGRLFHIFDQNQPPVQNMRNGAKIGQSLVNEGLFE